jgi:hypothetical protein
VFKLLVYAALKLLVYAALKLLVYATLKLLVYAALKLLTRRRLPQTPAYESLATTVCSLKVTNAAERLSARASRVYDE